MLKQEIREELNYKLRINGNGLRHCVRFEILLENESEISKIEVRMTKIWPIEDFRKFKIQPEIQIQPQTDWAGKFPAQPQVDWGVDPPQGPGRLGSRPGCRPGGRPPWSSQVGLVHLLAPLP